MISDAQLTDIEKKSQDSLLDVNLDNIDKKQDETIIRLSNEVRRLRMLLHQTTASQWSPDVLNAIGAAYASAQQQLALPPDSLTIRGLSYEDIGGILKFDTDDTSNQLSSSYDESTSYEKDFNQCFLRRRHLVDTCQFFVLTGFNCIGQADYISRVQIIRGGKIMRDEGGIMINSPKYFAPVKIDQCIPLEIRLYVQGNAKFYVDPFGFAIEPDGKTVNR